MTLDQLESFVAACKDDGIEPEQEIKVITHSGSVKSIKGATTRHPLVGHPCITVR
jgi:hypothetical protein